RIGLVAFEGPLHVVLIELLALVNRAMRRPVTLLRDERHAFAAMGIAGELVVAARHAAAIHEQLRAVGKRVFDRVVVEVLIDRIAAEVAAAAGLRANRPGIFHPATLVDVVNVEVAIRAAAGPQKAVETLYLVHQLADVVGLRSGREGRHWTVHAIGAQGDEVAHLAVLDALAKLAARDAVTAHQADANLQILLLSFFVQRQHALAGRTIDRNRLLHEDVYALFDRILVMR